MLRDQLVVGVQNQRIREKLLMEGDKLSWENAITLAKQIEAATMDNLKMQANEEIEIQAVDTNQRQQAVNIGKCHRCGSTRHAGTSATCFARDKLCFNCQKIGHIARVCKAPRRVEFTKKSNVHQLEETYQLLNIASIEISFVSIQCKLNGVPFTLIVDSGARVSVISKNTFDKMPISAKKAMRPINIQLRAYGGVLVEVIEQVDVTVEREGKSRKLEFIVAQGNVDILGMDNFEIFGVKLNVGGEIQLVGYAMNDQYTKELKEKYNSVFTGLGYAVGFMHKVKVNPEIKPVVQRLRRIPLSKQANVKTELQSMLEQDIIEPAEAAEWISNTVAITKKRIYTHMR